MRQPGPAQIFMRQVKDSLVICIAMNRCHKAFTIPNSSLRTFAMGAKQFVVQDPISITLFFEGSYLSAFTQRTNPAKSLHGADTITFLAPAVICFEASLHW
jgi:hypothetical protein